MTRLQAIAMLAAAALAGPVRASDQDDDQLMKAMKDEIQRVRSLRLPGLEAPYYAQYSIEDADMLNISATLGAVIYNTRLPARIDEVKVRVGDYGFDNSNYVFSSGSQNDTGTMPIEGNYLALRHSLWLATDRAFKSAEDEIARKKAALKNLNLPDPLPDFAKAPPVQAVLPAPRIQIDAAAMQKRAVDLSAIFAKYPEVQNSSVEFESVQSTTYFVNSEGTEVREPDNTAYFRIRANGQAADGSLIRDAAVVQAPNVTALPSEAAVRSAVVQVGDNVRALAQAKPGFAYTGPVLFEGPASPQLFGQVLGDNLKFTRKPVPEPGRTAPYRPSELESRIGSRIMPDWMDVVDDPTQSESGGQKLLGHYEYDSEGVAAKPAAIVEKGVFKDFLRTRTPVMKGFEGSNGHARLPGAYGADDPGIGNLIVRASQTIPAADMKKKLIELCKERSKPYCLIVRKLDWPSSASVEELRRELQAMASSGGRPVALPLLVYRVDMDGHEELVRGLRFRGFSARSFRDILAASDQPYVYNFVDSSFPFALMGAGGFVTNSTVIAPAVLFEEVEFEQIVDETPNLPIAPAPPAKQG